MSVSKRFKSDSPFGKFKPDSQDLCSSKFKFKNFKLEWEIEDFEFVCNSLKVLESPRFPFSETETLKWYLQLEPTPLDKNNEGKFQIYLKNTDNSNRHLRVYIAFFSSSKKIQGFKEAFGKFDTLRNWSTTGADLYRLSLNEDQKLPKDITVICELSVFDSGINTVKKPLAFSNDSTVGILGHFKDFLNDQVFKDVKFTIQNEEFNAHRVILACRSPVFSEMFKNKMKGKLVSTVKIKYFKASIFSSMLRFIYTDEVENLEESALELFYAAHQFQLEKLKNMCLNSLYNNLSAKNVLKILELADKFSISKLKDKALDVLSSCLEAVEESKEYLQFSESHPHLVEILKLQRSIASESETKIDVSNHIIFEVIP